MSNRFTTLSVAATLALAALTANARADEAGAVDATKTVGAMRLETGRLATSYADVQRQGGFVTPAAVVWGRAPVEAEAKAAYNAGSVGAMRLETGRLAASFADVQRQGGFVTPTSVTWTSAPVEADAMAGAAYNAGSVGALTLETIGRAIGPTDVRRQSGALTTRNIRWVSAPAAE